ncbi:ornithine decarboxylase-like isoform X2 [Lytechinus variegatus]|uniref:ornithine decarboxylase-like isoform X2 n=1 Tax=Lytechinus variegatus TaxID=7654 RepID=UPI001BB12C1E|nr:ornithine decarboxylase-like isoform X2 [Lytechinus variegatus]
MNDPNTTISNLITVDDEDPFFVLDLKDVEEKHHLWKQEFPNVQPFYAVKCNSNRRVLETLAKLGAGFDCASKAELQQVLDLGVQPNRIIYAHPCKAKSHLMFAKENDVRLMTFDNEDELVKIKEVFPNARLVLRIWAEDTTAVFPLSVKFGCQLHEVHHLLKTAKKLDLTVEGISFHVGSGSGDPDSYYTAIQDARTAYDIGNGIGHDLRMIDIGGGFPGKESSSVPFHKFSSAARRAITKYFPESDIQNPRIIGEPGTFYVQSAFSLAVCVIGKRDLLKNPFLDPKDENWNSIDLSETPEVAYYINSNVYSSFKDAKLMDTLFDVEVLKSSNINGRKRASILWGNTTSGFDCVRRHCQLPELEEGDWLLFRDMGAYAMAISSEYSGFKLPICYTLQKDE